MTILYTITVDTEEEWDWRSGWPTSGFGVANIARLPPFQDLCSRYGAAVTYFANYAVMHNPESRAIVLKLAKENRVEIGMHIHPWNTPPLSERSPVSARDSFLHNLPPGLIEGKLASVYDLFVTSGLRPTSFRGGRYSTGEVVQQFLRSRGFLADASVLPYTAWGEDGAPDYRTRGLMPRRSDDPPDGGRPLWEIPLTRGFTRRPSAVWRRFYDLAEHTWLARLHVVGIAERAQIVRRVWLNFEQHSAEAIVGFLGVLRRRHPPHVSLTLHSSSLLAGSSPYTRTKEDEQRLFGSVERVLDRLAEWPEFEPATITAVAQRLESQHHACSRYQPA